MPEAQLAVRNQLADWVRRNRASTTIVLLIASAFMFKYQDELKPPSPSELRREGVYVTHVGKLERSVSGGNRQSFNIHTDAGYGIGFPNDRESNALIKRLQPTLFVPFSSALSISEAELTKISPNKEMYFLTLWRGEIIEMSTSSGQVFPIERVLAHIERSKRTWRFISVLALVLSIVFWVVATILQKQRHASEPEHHSSKGQLGEPSSAPDA